MAIKIRFSAFKKEDAPIEFPINDGQLLSDELSLILETTRPDIKEKAEEFLSVAVNGAVITPEMWPFTKLRASDNVLVVTKLKSGDTNSLLRIGVILAVSYFTFGAGTAVSATLFSGSTFGAWAVTAGIGMLATYGAYQLFPPPVPGSGALSGSSEYSGSQMYSISNQSNTVKKYGYVPRVYGTHRMFPIVAANPYTDLEADPVTGQLSQYLYCVYDFGFGPNLISNLKIGNTPIENFTDVTYNFVDFNKPAVSEGPWDDVLKSTLSLYKGDIFSENVGVALNGNQSAGDPQADWQIIRNANINPDLLKQEIIINFSLPRGLYSLNSGGGLVTRNIFSILEFSKVGENNWKSYNGPDVDSYSVTGIGVPGNENLPDLEVTDPTNLGALPVTRDLVLPTTEWRITYQKNITNFGNVVVGVSRSYERFFYVGLLEGSTYIDLPTSSLLGVGARIHFNNQQMGVVASTEDIGFGIYTRYHLVAPLSQSILLASFKQTSATEGFTSTPESGINGMQVLSRSVLQFAYPPASIKFAGQSSEPTFATVKFTPTVPGEYKIRFTRTSTTSAANTGSGDDLTFSVISTRTDNLPINTTKRHTFIELRIKATGQLNGTIQNLSGELSSVLNVYDGTSWALASTSNPAWIFADVLTGQANKRPVPLTRLDVNSLKEWADFCDEIPAPSPSNVYVQKRYESNFIMDFDTTVQQLLHKISGGAQASFNIVDGKYGVLIDRRQSSPVQIFTPRNSSNFQSQRGYTEKPHGLKVTYVDPASDWQPQEVIVYDNNYNINNADTFEEITTFGITKLEQATRFGRYFLAQNRLRQETISLDVDFEYLVCTRGDFVQITQDTMKAGGTPARVRKIVGNRVTIDEGIDTDPLINYGYVFRAITGGIHVNTLTIVTADTFDLNGTPLPQAGDLIIIGEVGNIVYDCIVKSIQPRDDLAATLTLVERADAIFDIDQYDNLPDYAANLSRTGNQEIAPPPAVEDLAIVANTYNILQSGYEYYMDLDWNPPAGAAYEFFEVYVDNGTGYAFKESVAGSNYRYIVDQAKLDTNHKFKVLAVSSTGKKLALGEVGFVEDIPLAKRTPPSDVSPFNSDITGETLQLFWKKIPDLDALSYLIRYSSSPTGSWETSTILNRVSHPTDLYSTQARTGLYLIKAVDFAGNESANATAIFTTIPQLFGLNVIDTLNDFPALPGVRESVEIVGDSLVLAKSLDGPIGTEEYYPQGYYYYENLLDLGDVYTVRLQSLLQAEGLTLSDLMVNWTPLSSVDYLYSPGSSDWDVQAEYRATNSLNVIADWTLLSDIVAMSSGTEDQFTEWRRFNIGDATGRIFQFRLSLISNKPSVTPRVLNGIIRADMPDRVDSYGDVSSSSGVATVVYDPSFKGPGLTPAVGITLENGQSGDYWVFNSKTLAGFEIAFFDKNNLAVDRTFDALVRGFGRRGTDSI